MRGRHFANTLNEIGGVIRSSGPNPAVMIVLKYEETLLVRLG